MGVFISVLFTMPGILENITSIQAISSEVLVLENSIRNTYVNIVDLEAEAGSIMVNFTLTNNGTEKLWDYENFNLLITYDADIGGVKTPVTEEFIYAESLIAEDVKIQRGVTVFGAAGDTFLQTIDSVGSIGNGGNAFVRITNVQYASAGPDAGAAADRNNEDLGVRARLTDTDEITFTRLASGLDEDVRVAWEVWEYIGAPGRVNEFIVRLDTEVTTTDANPVDTNIPGFDVLGNLVPFITGVTNDRNDNRDWDDATHTAEIIDPGGGLADVRIDRDGAANTSIVGVIVVEFTGTNWIIQNNIAHNFASTNVETEPITAVNSWNEAFISSTYHARNGEDEREELAANVWPGPTTGLVNFDLSTVDNIGPQYRVVAHIIENSGMVVQHLDSNTGGQVDFPAGGGGAQTVTRIITPVDEMSETGLISTAYNTGGDRRYPRPFWNYNLIADDTVEFFRGRSAGGSTEWTLDVIEFPRSEKAGTGPCFGGFIRNDLWTIDSIINDQLEPGILNNDESLQICSGLLYPIFSGGEIAIVFATDLGVITSTATTVP